MSAKNVRPRANGARPKSPARARAAQAPAEEELDSAASRRDLERLLYEAARMRANRAASGG